MPPQQPGGYPQQGQPPMPPGQPGYQPPSNNPYPATRMDAHPVADDPYAAPHPDDRYGYPDDRYGDPYRDGYDYDDRRDRYDDRHREPERDRRRDRDDDRPRSRDREFHGPSADAIGRTIQVVTGLIAFVFVLHIIFSVTGANPDNSFVSFTYSTAKIFVFGLGDVFTPGDATIGLVLNYGLAAAIYLYGGRIIGKALKR
ncbi:hypothetical protein GCM10009854_03610 [Saccharopolyspora halophila]|uniref:Uncharacterized protein n=2 Tax=Saccharopolyspora halophila TaxID=405551 RepID=A0ABP5SI50_9PSEU